MRPATGRGPKRTGTLGRCWCYRAERSTSYCSFQASATVVVGGVGRTTRRAQDGGDDGATTRHYISLLYFSTLRSTEYIHLSPFPQLRELSSAPHLAASPQVSIRIPAERSIALLVCCANFAIVKHQPSHLTINHRGKCSVSYYILGKKVRRRLRAGCDWSCTEYRRPQR